MAGSHLLSRRCAQVLTDLFLPRAVLPTVLVPGRRHFPARLATGSAVRAAWAPVASPCRLTAAFTSRS